MKTQRSWLEQGEQIGLTVHIPPTSSHRCSQVELGVSFPSHHPDREYICKNKQNILIFILCALSIPAAFKGSIGS